MRIPEALGAVWPPNPAAGNPGWVLALCAQRPPSDAVFPPGGSAGELPIIRAPPKLSTVSLQQDRTPSAASTEERAVPFAIKPCHGAGVLLQCVHVEAQVCQGNNDACGGLGWRPRSLSEGSARADPRPPIGTFRVLVDGYGRSAGSFTTLVSFNTVLMI